MTEDTMNIIDPFFSTLFHVKLTHNLQFRSSRLHTQFLTRIRLFNCSFTLTTQFAFSQSQWSAVFFSGKMNKLFSNLEKLAQIRPNEISGMDFIQTPLKRYIYPTFILKPLIENKLANTISRLLLKFRVRIWTMIINRLFSFGIDSEIKRDFDMGTDELFW